MKEKLCQAFCERMFVDRVPAGWAVQTPYRLHDGDPVMFFIMTISQDVARLEDDGTTIGLLEGDGVSLDKRGARYEALNELLTQHDAEYDEQLGVIRTADMPIDDIADASVNFAALMLRIHDLALLSVERVKQSWQDDAKADLHAKFDSVATVEENVPVTSGVGSIPADMVIRTPDAPPVAIIFATSQTKGLHALVLKMELAKYQNEDAPVLLLVERARTNPLAEGTYALAQSRLDGVFTYRGTETDALSAVGRMVGQHGTLQ